MNIESLALFSFGALAFSILTAFYWGERRKGPGGSAVLPAFTLACSAAFLLSLTSRLLPAAAEGAILLARNVASGLLAPLILHLVIEAAESRRYWRGPLFAIYGCAIVAAAAKGCDEAGLLSLGDSDLVYRSPILILAAASALGAAAAIIDRRTGRAHRRWTAALLGLMAICAGAGLLGVGGIASQMPDYLVLAFFCVTLYYRERLAFFDLLVKRGLFLAAGLTILTVWLRAAEREESWTMALAMLALWLLGPWVYGRVSRLTDRAWLRRRYSSAEAERQFLQDVQTAATEEELRERAARSLSEVFRTEAEVAFDGAAPRSAHAERLGAAIRQRGAPAGSILLPPRPDGIPFLSDDRRLLDALAGALGVVLENVRFLEDRRRQQEREQELRWLAGRAELKALRAQINPHFLFNALSVIAGLMRYRPELAEDTIERLAQVFRYTLRQSNREWTALAEEVEFVRAYLGVEQARFGDRLSVAIEIDPVAALRPIPAMSIQPLIENAIRHGVSALEGRGSVALRAAMLGETLEIEVSDNGPGFPAGFTLEDSGEGHGLRNVRDRLRGYYGDAARLCWESNENGARVLLALPSGRASSCVC